jgi:2-methylisocitrate lyase-like PEP mutase family enzyme
MEHITKVERAEAAGGAAIQLEDQVFPKNTDDLKGKRWSPPLR